MNAQCAEHVSIINVINIVSAHVCLITLLYIYMRYTYICYIYIYTKIYIGNLLDD